MLNIDNEADPSALNANDYVMAREVAEALHQHYPGHLWAVQCEGRTGLITIRDLLYAGTYGYRLKLKDVYSMSSLKKDVIIAGGEILERFKATRGKFNQDEYLALPTDFAGRLRFDK